MSIRIVTDSACDLPDDLVERYGMSRTGGTSVRGSVALQ